MGLYELLGQVANLVEDTLAETVETAPEAIGLDRRCGRVYVGKDYIAVAKCNDRNLQYYGGFEYAQDHRSEIGDYVFYSTESARVQGHAERI